MKYIERAREVLDVEIAGLNKVREALGPEFDRAVDRVLAALAGGKKIVVTGVGKNIPIGQKIAATLTSTGSPAVFLHPSDAMHGELGIVEAGDIVLALSYSGESEELLTLLPAIRRNQVCIIGLCANRDNALARCSDEVILIAVDAEACPFNMAPTTSTTVTLAVGDALAMVLLDARGFTREDYAKLHPGGAIGRTLLLRVRDIMRTGERVARIRLGAKVRDAILAMTEAKSGVVAVVDESDRLCGIFTDGDLRRHITRPAPVTELRIDDVMTPRPVVLGPDHLAVDALNLFQKHNIDDLVIVDEAGRLVGMVDIQDLPKFKIL
jgi:arabinose-5-phosphate isomerase